MRKLIVFFTVFLSFQLYGQIPSELFKTSGFKGGVIAAAGSITSAEMLELSGKSSFLVHIIELSKKNVQVLKKDAYLKGKGGKVTVSIYNGSYLPFIDNFVNVLICTETMSISSKEIDRVLVPGGIVYTQKDMKLSSYTSESAVQGWKKYRKPVSSKLDEWTHFMHGPDNNPVSKDDVVGHPYHIQWVAGQKSAKDHTKSIASTQVIVSAGGVIYYIAEETPLALTFLFAPKWYLYARDAYNGVLLWKRKIDAWQTSKATHWMNLPPDSQRRLIAGKEKLYFTTTIVSPVSVLDPANGKVLKTFKDTKNAEELLLIDDILVVLCGTYNFDEVDRYALTDIQVTPLQKKIMAIDTKTGKTLWTINNKTTHGIMPLGLAADNGSVVYQSFKGIHLADLKTGKKKWTYEHPVVFERTPSRTTTLIIKNNVVLMADALPDKVKKWPKSLSKDDKQRLKKVYKERKGVGKVVALSVKNGKLLWEAPCTLGVGSPPDMFYANGLVWIGENKGRKDQDYRKGRDILTGKVKKEIPVSEHWPQVHHDRCYRDRATEKFILAGRTGIEYIDLNAGTVNPHTWVRGICQFGILPGNGSVYVPANNCSCYIQSQMKDGFYSLTPKRTFYAADVDDGKRLEKGSAYELAGKLYGKNAETDWPVYRRDAGRSGHFTTKINKKPVSKWITKIGGALTAPVSADGKVYTAQMQEGVLWCVNAIDGKVLWKYLAGGKIDVPPSVQGGILVFGSHNGTVYALNAIDGKVLWKFFAFPKEQYMFDHGSLQSVWPVIGGVYIKGKTVYFNAGRSTYMDGGMYMYALDLLTGKIRHKKKYYSRDQKTGLRYDLFEPYSDEYTRKAELPGLLPDVFSDDGKNLYLRSVMLDYKLSVLSELGDHIYSPTGFLDGESWQRSYFVYGKHSYGLNSGTPVASQLFPAGRLLVTDEKNVFGYQEVNMYVKPKANNSILFSMDKHPDQRELKKSRRHTPLFVLEKNWSVDIGMHPSAMIVGEKYVYATGPAEVDVGLLKEYREKQKVDAFSVPENIQEQTDLFLGEKGSLLKIVSKKDGAELYSVRVPSKPVWDGMIAADSKLFIALKNGSLVCYE
jgi:outer membrane protein assembly factor BamB